MGEIKRAARRNPSDFSSQANSKQKSKQTCLQNSVFACVFLKCVSIFCNTRKPWKHWKTKKNPQSVEIAGFLVLVREGGLEPPRPEWTLEPESAEVFDLCYGFCFPLRCCRFWQPRLDFPNTALDCGIFVIYILIIASDFAEGKEFFFKNKQVWSNFIETRKQLYSILLPALKQQLGWREL